MQEEGKLIESTKRDFENIHGAQDYAAQLGQDYLDSLRAVPVAAPDNRSLHLDDSGLAIFSLRGAKLIAAWLDQWLGEKTARMFDVIEENFNANNFRTAMMLVYNSAEPADLQEVNNEIEAEVERAKAGKFPRTSRDQLLRCISTMHNTHRYLNDPSEPARFLQASLQNWQALLLGVALAGKEQP